MPSPTLPLTRLSTQNSHQRPYPFFHHLHVPAPLKQTNKQTKKKQARRREEKQWKKERAGGKSEQRASPSRGFIIPHIRRTVDLSLHLIPATLSLSLPLSPPLWNRYSLLFLPPGRVAPPPPPLSLSLSFFLSSLPNSWFPFDEHDEERKNDEPCCRNGIGLINVGGPQIWLNSEQRWTSSRIKFLPEAYTTLSRTRSPFSRLFGSANTRIRFFRGETFQS